MSDHCNEHHKYDPDCLECLDAMNASETSELAPAACSAAVPRIYTRCPACHNSCLTINNGHLLCTWLECPDPTLIDRIGEPPPQNA